MQHGRTGMTDLLMTVGDLTLTDRFFATRSLTESLASPLSAEDQTVQSMPDVSPTKWHRAHTTWFFETFLLIPSLGVTDPSTRRTGTCSTRTTRAWAPGIRATTGAVVAARYRKDRRVPGVRGRVDGHPARGKPPLRRWRRWSSSESSTSSNIKSCC